MDAKELRETHCCSKCVHCFDEFDHYKWLLFVPYDQPSADHLRYYCNQEHENVLPWSVKPCFNPR